MSELGEEETFAIKKAEQVAKAIEKKLGNYKAYVRLIQAAEYNFIEIGIRKNNDTPANEIQVAYSQTYFNEMVDNETTLNRAKRILKDVCIHLNLPYETNAA